MHFSWWFQMLSWYSTILTFLTILWHFWTVVCSCLSRAKYWPCFVNLFHQQLAKQLPPRTEGYSWSLLYSTSIHGFSLTSLYRSCRGIDSPILLVVKDADNTVSVAYKPHSVSYTAPQFMVSACAGSLLLWYLTMHFTPTKDAGTGKAKSAVHWLVHSSVSIGFVMSA